ncbi:lysophospholipid acyltransferase family protein [Streptomyces durocortorensis]|uniref:1-acyl-sn-glycerol-3-phosphate acyltransferase n=1 Tax=Streptomyces durocortorensis TaxID=2811104 RepID=A0ABS2HU25_9ACTN|nr:lysophospholipid acyltransferase family protein [Streptomyces durocortorensis]MBM7054529.1 1-acyl-sn-glycerol-3-phosphate acyltransferase [Streptomyces durocortorensis]
MSVWLPVAPCTPAGCARHTGAVRAPLPAALLLLSGCTLVLLGVACVPLVRLLGPAPRRRLTRCWAHAVPRAFGVRVTVRRHAADHPSDDPSGDAPGGELVVANHISWLDIPLVACVLPGRMVAKSEIRRWPLLGPLAALGGTLFIDRDRLRALPAAVRTIATSLRSGSRVVVFPEGSTWCGRGGGGAFRPAAFQAAVDAGATVRPVRIAYRTAAHHDGPAAGAVAFVGSDPLAASLWRVVRAAGLTARIDVLAPIPADGEDGRRALADRARTAVLTTEDPCRCCQTAVASDRANRPAESVHH